MAFVLILLLQAALPPADPAWQTEGSERSLQLKILPEQDCTAQDSKEIVVCGTRGDSDRYRIPRLGSEYETGALKAEMNLMKGVTGGVQLDQVAFPNGTVSKRLMVTAKIKF